ncbi:MAG: hypothetical protein M3345_01165 [Actinomycetota bacterium]|nr:hypothetical protein [Actinomycetota bacterium]
MSSERACGWMSGPKNAAVDIAPTRWWLAVTRGTLAKAYMAHTAGNRTPAMCHRAPSFRSPIGDRSA